MKRKLNRVVKNISEGVRGGLATARTTMICEGDFETRSEFEAEVVHVKASLRPGDPEPLVIYLSEPVKDFINLPEVDGIGNLMHRRYPGKA